MGYYDPVSRGMVESPDEGVALQQAVEELRKLTKAMIEAAGQKPDAPVIKVDVPPAQIIHEKEESNADIVQALKAVGATLGQLLSRRQEAPVVQVQPAQINIPDIAIPEIRIPEIKMPAITFPEQKPQAAVSWKFKHRYDEYGKLIETTATPQ